MYLHHYFRKGVHNPHRKNPFPNMPTCFLSVVALQYGIAPYIYLRLPSISALTRQLKLTSHL